jgi:hypothetical protein
MIWAEATSHTNTVLSPPAEANFALSWVLRVSLGLSLSLSSSLSLDRHFADARGLYAVPIASAVEIPGR